MSIYGALKESLDMKGSSILLHLLVDTLSLMLIADISSPSFLDGNSCTSTVDDLIDIENEGFFIILEHRHDVGFLLAGLELQCS